YPGTELGDWAMANTKILVDDVTDASHFGAKEQVFMETPEFPKADREEVFRILATDYRDGSISNEEFKTLYKATPPLRSLFIRSGRMDPYEHLRELLPEGSTLDVLASFGIVVTDPNVDSVFHYPNPGLMRITGLGRLKNQLRKSYDLAIYLNTFQNGM